MTSKKAVVIVVDPGETVVCDICNEDWTSRRESGGIQFGDRACCPFCAANVEKSAEDYGEEEHIVARCPEGKPFADWVREDLR